MFRECQMENDIYTSIKKYQKESIMTHYNNLTFINPHLLDEAYDTRELNEFAAAQDSEVVQSEGCEEKYVTEDNNQHMTLQTKHIIKADAFIIVYDVRFIEELEKIKIWLDKIFIIKGYDKLLDTMENDGMCFFPITLMGINKNVPFRTLDEDKDEKENMRITMSKIGKFSLDYCVDYLSTSLFDGALWKSLRDFRENVVTFYKYMSLEDKSKYSLQTYNSNTCYIL